MKSPRERYLSDPMFSTLVDTIRGYLENTTFTPTELREAVILASILYYEKYPYPSLDKEGEIWKWLNQK